MNNRLTYHSLKSFFQETQFFALILINTFVNLIGGSTGGNIFFYFSVAILISYSLTVNFNFKINFVVKVYSIVVLISLISLIYSKDILFVIEDLPRVLSNYITIIIASTFIHNYNRLKKALFIFISCITFLALPNLLFTQGGIREMYWGGVNQVGAIMFFGLIFSIIMTFLKSKLYLIPIPLFLGVMLLTQSQKVILSLAILLTIFSLTSLIVEGVRKYRRYILVIALFGITIYYLITKTSIGDSFLRTEATLTELQTGESVAGSALGSGFRNYLIDKGISYFLEKPLFGHGLNQYRYLFRLETGINTYSHNTWLELLVSFGLVVTLLYSMIYLKISKSLILTMRRTKSSLLIFIFSSIITVIIIGQFQKMFYDVFTHLFLVIALLITNIESKKLLHEY